VAKLQKSILGFSHRRS